MWSGLALVLDVDGHALSWSAVEVGGHARLLGVHSAPHLARGSVVVELERWRRLALVRPRFVLANASSSPRLPVVATTAGGIRSLVEHDRNGMLVAERDARALAEAIGALLRDPDRRSRLGREGRALVEARFGWDATAARLEAAYDRALAFKSLTR